MSILATVTKPSSGTFSRDGAASRRASATRSRCRRELGYLPQDFGVYPKLTGREFLLYLGRLKGLSGADLDRRVQELLELTNLHGAASRRLGGYSGGMRQRIGIAQALLGDPRLVIVDEPTVGLDPEERVRFRNLLAEIAQGRVVILSTHIVSDVEAVASHIAVIRQGRLVLHATPEALLSRAPGASSSPSSPPTARARRGASSSPSSPRTDSPRRSARSTCRASSAAPTASTCATWRTAAHCRTRVKSSRRSRTRTCSRTSLTATNPSARVTLAERA